ncbi:MAG: SBBP repeat-containing protein [Acidobacteriota bacterium]
MSASGPFLPILLFLFGLIPDSAVHKDPARERLEQLAERESPRLPKAVRSKIAQSYGRLPLSFEPNRGQSDPRVKFLSHGRGYTLFLTSDESVLVLGSPPTAASTAEGLSRSDAPAGKVSDVLRIQWLGASSPSEPEGLARLPGASHYFTGRDPNTWHTGISTYAKVRYENLYPGIDLLYYGNREGQLEFDLVVAPGARPHAIALQFEGAEKIELNSGGDLLLYTSRGALQLRRPAVYQNVGGAPRAVAARYVLKGRTQVGIEVGAYDTGESLVVDPVLVYSTYLGGSAFDTGCTITVDAAGNAYLTGGTLSTDFPTANPLQPSNEGNRDTYIAKLGPGGSTLLYSTYLGGSGLDEGKGIAVDAIGNAYVTGNTFSSDFPTLNPLQPARGGSVDGFVAKVSRTGASLLYSTYLGGRAADRAQGIDVGPLGNAYVIGSTFSDDFPTANPLQPTSGGGQDAFLSKLNGDGSALIYSTYLGGSDGENVVAVPGISVDDVGNAYLAGDTASLDFPTAAALQPSSGGGVDAFAAKLDPSGLVLIYSTYFGGSGTDAANGVAFDSAGHAYLAGVTDSVDLPTANPIQSALAGGQDAFAAKLDPSGTSLVYSTYLGGGGDDEAAAIAVGGDGSAYLAGLTDSLDWPTSSPLQAELAGATDAFLSQLDPAGSALVFSTYLGGTDLDRARHVAVDPTGNIYLAGQTNSLDFPTQKALQPALTGDHDAFVAVVGSPCTLNLELTLTGPILSMDFTVGTFQPATWEVWLSVQGRLINLFSFPLPTTYPPRSIPISIPGFPPLGTIGVLTTLSTEADGILCLDLETIDTGAESALP